jgi:FkbM family methyltransferase
MGGANMDFAGAARRYLRGRIHFSLMGRSLWSLQVRLCPTLGARLRLLFVYVILVLNAFSGRSTKAAARRLRIQAAGRDRDWWVADPMEVAALWTVFVSGEYADFLPRRPRIIVDGGANVGSATLWFRERFPDARVIALEPNPKAFERLKRNVGDDPNVELVNAALSGSDGKASFSLEEMTTLQGRLEADADGGAPRSRKVEVDAFTLGTIRDRFADGAQIDVLKLNVEGAEWSILAGPLTNVGTIAIEIHEPVPGNRDPDAVLSEVAAREGLELRQGYSQTLAPRNLRWLVPTRVAKLASTSGVSS